MNKYDKIKFIPPAAVARKAAEGLKLHEKFKKGGTLVGIARAHQLEKRSELNPQIVNRMYSYFARHEIDKKGKDFFNKLKPSKGYIAWLLWGGDAGKKWVDSLKKKMSEADEKSK